MVRPTPKITKYLGNLNLKSVEEMVKVREEHLLPPKKEAQKCANDRLRQIPWQIGLEYSFARPRERATGDYHGEGAYLERYRGGPHIGGHKFDIGINAQDGPQFKDSGSK